MSTNKNKKRVVVSTQKTKKKVTPTASTRTKSAASISNKPAAEMVFGKSYYTMMLAGLGLIFLGLLCMLGGAQPSPDVWEDDIIYNWRITVLAPILILAGLVLEIYAIFKR